MKVFQIIQLVKPEEKPVIIEREAPKSQINEELRAALDAVDFSSPNLSQQLDELSGVTVRAKNDSNADQVIQLHNGITTQFGEMHF